MRWENLRRSSNIDDRRSSGRTALKGGAGGVFVMALVVYLLGGDPTGLLMEGVSRTIQTSSQRASTISLEEQNHQADFVAAVLGSTENSWTENFAKRGQVYQAPRLIMFAGGVDSACGMASSAMGPFYCAQDQSIYIDLDFFHDLEARFKAPGDFARAYVIAHEVGHHLQNLLGTLPRVHELQAVAGKSKANALSVKLELQADCYAGVWASTLAQTQILEPDDMNEALRAASQIGDDKIQEEAQGYAVPDSFTHGSAADRAKWFQQGFAGGTSKAVKPLPSRGRHFP